MQNCTISIQYKNQDQEKLEYIGGKSDWIDLRSNEQVVLKTGEFKLIDLGVAMKLPRGYEAHVVPRSSTFNNYSVIQGNHFGVIDNAYSGNNDIWKMKVVAFKDTTIEKGDRICQFRIIENQPNLNFIECSLGDTDRGGFGSTGTN